MLVQVHDELLVEAPEGEVARVSALIRDTMERVASLKVPLSVNVAVGVTWNEAHG
jgi:DNA polymerase-1